MRNLVYQLVTPLPFFLQYFLVEAAFGLFLTFLMIFRGLLFAELNGIRGAVEFIATKRDHRSEKLREIKSPSPSAAVSTVK